MGDDKPAPEPVPVEVVAAVETASTQTSTTNQDDLIMQQQRRIEQEINESTAIVSDLEPIISLQSEYENDSVYLKKIEDLASKYSHIRRTRPDGNCFYRSFAYRYLETILADSAEYKRFYEIAAKSKDNLLQLGFPKFTVEDFHETFMEVIDRVGRPGMTAEDLHELFNRQSVSDYIVVYLRLITSGQLQKESEFYQNFIDGERTVDSFCHQEVEPMYRESDHIHIIALSSALGVGVRVRYMDRSGDGTGQVIAHDFPAHPPHSHAQPAVHLLYRPGHYDMLYPL